MDEEVVSLNAQRDSVRPVVTYKGQINWQCYNGRNIPIYFYTELTVKQLWNRIYNYGKCNVSWRGTLSCQMRRHNVCVSIEYDDSEA